MPSAGGHTLLLHGRSETKLERTQQALLETNPDALIEKYCADLSWLQDVDALSKLAITMWSFHLAHAWPTPGPVVVAVSPATLLGSKMVREAYGTPGNDLGIGADILVRARL